MRTRNWWFVTKYSHQRRCCCSFRDGSGASDSGSGTPPDRARTYYSTTRWGWGSFPPWTPRRFVGTRNTRLFLHHRSPFHRRDSDAVSSATINYSSSRDDPTASSRRGVHDYNSRRSRHEDDDDEAHDPAVRGTATAPWPPPADASRRQRPRPPRHRPPFPPARFSPPYLRSCALTTE